MCEEGRIKKKKKSFNKDLVYRRHQMLVLACSSLPQGGGVYLKVFDRLPFALKVMPNSRAPTV